MKVFITKYALTQGIFETDVKVISEDMVKDLNQKYPTYYHGKNKDWHEDRISALLRATRMRDDKIKSLEKSINKMKSLTFA